MWRVGEEALDVLDGLILSLFVCQTLGILMGLGEM